MANTPPPAWYEQDETDHHDLCRARRDRLAACGCAALDALDEQEEGERRWEARSGK